MVVYITQIYIYFFVAVDMYTTIKQFIKNEGKKVQSSKFLY